MSCRWRGLAVAGSLALAAAGTQAQTGPTNRIARMAQTISRSGQQLTREEQTGYLRSLLDALHIPMESQLLVFSKTGVQQAYTGPRTPRALYFDESVVVGYVPGAPEIEIIAHDPTEGLAFYTLDQTAASPLPVRRTSCLTCHESPSTYDVPGFIVRSHTVDANGNVLRNANLANSVPTVNPANAVPPSHDVDQTTSHPDRWGGWLVTLEGEAPPYAQRAHQGNITFSAEGNTSSQVFIEWMASAPESRGYPSLSSDIVSLLVFDHQMPAINLMTRLNFQWRRANGEGRSSVDAPEIRALVDDLAAYLSFAREASLPVPLTPRAGFARALEARIPRDSKGRSLAQLDGTNRLLRYPCSYMIYSDAFEALPTPVRQAVYRRIADNLTQPSGDRRFEHAKPEDRHAALDILRATKPDFP